MDVSKSSTDIFISDRGIEREIEREREREEGSCREREHADG